MFIERNYNVPLRKGFVKHAKHKKTKKAVSVLKEFLSRHMKSDKILIGGQLNKHLWKDGIKNPPHHVKITAIKEDDGTVKAELLGFKYEHKKKDEKEQKEDKKKDAKESEAKKKDNNKTQPNPEHKKSDSEVAVHAKEHPEHKHDASAKPKHKEK